MSKVGGGCCQHSRGPPHKYLAISIAEKLMPIPKQQRQTRHSNCMSNLHEPSGLAIVQFNIEGLTQPKCEAIQKIAMNNSVAVILLQETHATNDDKITIYGYSLIGSINHPKHGIATLVRNDLPATEIGHSRVDSAIQWLTISIDGEITITNFYKPPNSPFDPPPQYKL